jgi:paired amphipathic helix protein Sin3a
VSDNKCQELWQFLRRHRSEALFMRQDVINYRRQAEHHVGTDDNLYRVEWVGDRCAIYRAMLIKVCDRALTRKRCAFS